MNSSVLFNFFFDMFLLPETDSFSSDQFQVVTDVSPRGSWPCQLLVPRGRTCVGDQQTVVVPQQQQHHQQQAAEQQGHQQGAAPRHWGGAAGERWGRRGGAPAMQLQTETFGSTWFYFKPAERRRHGSGQTGSVWDGPGGVWVQVGLSWTLQTVTSELLEARSSIRSPPQRATQLVILFVFQT